MGRVSEIELDTAEHILAPIKKNPFISEETLQHTTQDMLGMVGTDPATNPLSELVFSLSIAASLKYKYGRAFLRSLDTPQKREEARQELNEAIANHPAKDSPQCKQLKALAILLTETSLGPLYALDDRNAPFYKIENEQNASDVFHQVAEAFDDARALYGLKYVRGISRATQLNRLRQELAAVDLGKEVDQLRRELAKSEDEYASVKAGLKAIEELRERNQRLANELTQNP